MFFDNRVCCRLSRGGRRSTILKTPVSQTDQAAQFGYDALGRLSTLTDFNGKVTAFAYYPITGTSAGMLQSKTASVSGTNTGESVTYAYNGDGTRKTAIRTPATGGGATVTTNYAYYATGDYRQGQLKTVKTTASGGVSRTLTYDYDTLGNKASVLTPSGSLVKYAYDALNRLSTVTHPDSAVTSFGYDKVGNRQSVTRKNAAGTVFSTTGYGYDSLNRLTDIVNKNGSSAVVSSYHYGLRADGKRYAVTESGPYTSNATTNYTYDDAGKLTMEAGPYATIAYTYDLVGNRKTRTVSGVLTGNGNTLTNGTATFTYDANDRITSGGHTYDNDGNEKTVNGQAATYDFENHLVSLASVANGTILASYIYDADGNRYSAYNSAATPTTTTYVVDTSLPYASVVEEYTGTTPTLSARYDYGDDLIRMDRVSPASTSYYLFDGLGSTRQLVSTSGTPTDTYAYDAFGEQAGKTGNTANPFLFNAQQYDQASGDYYLRARYYDQSVGRFISQDGFEGQNQDPVSLHRYLYADGDPVNIQDPGGKDGELVGLATSIAISATIGGIVGAGINAARDAIFNPNSNFGSILSAAGSGFGAGFAIGGLVAIPGLGPYVLGGATAWGGWGIGTEFSQGRYGEALFDFVTLFGALGLAHSATVGPPAVKAGGYTEFYSAQGSEDAARLRAGGDPWPTKPYRSALGEGLYTFASKAEAETYLAKRQKTLIENYGTGDDMEVMTFRIKNSDLSSLRRYDVNQTDDDEANSFLDQYDSGSGEYQYMTKGTNFGTEHYFHSSVFNLFEVQ